MVYWQTVVNASTSIWREVLKKSTDVEVPLKEAWLRCLHPPLNPLGRASRGTQFSDEPTQFGHNCIFKAEAHLHFFPYRLHAQSLTDTMIEARRQSVQSSGIHINFDAVKCVAKVQKLQPMHQYKYWYRKSQTIQSRRYKKRRLRGKFSTSELGNKPDVHLRIEPNLRRISIPPVQNLHTLLTVPEAQIFFPRISTSITRRLRILHLRTPKRLSSIPLTLRNSILRTS